MGLWAQDLRQEHVCVQLSELGGLNVYAYRETEVCLPLDKPFSSLGS
jgi:hypothetical protein